MAALGRTKSAPIDAEWRLCGNIELYDMPAEMFVDGPDISLSLDNCDPIDRGRLVRAQPDVILRGGLPSGYSAGRRRTVGLGGNQSACVGRLDKKADLYPLAASGL